MDFEVDEEGIESRSGFPLKEEVMFSARAILSSMLMWLLPPLEDGLAEDSTSLGLMSVGLPPPRPPLLWRRERPKAELSVKLILVTSSSSSSAASVLMTMASVLKGDRRPGKLSLAEELLGQLLLFEELTCLGLEPDVEGGPQ
jgi:hypothetical protein